MDINNNVNRHVTGDEKRRSSRLTLTTTSLQENCDLICAAATEEQIAFTPLPRIESDDESSTSDEDLDFEAYVDNYNYYEHLSGRGTGAELGFLDEEDNEMNMAIDPDELSYEELIELGEFIGEEKRGLSVEEISGCISATTYQTVDIRTGTDMCVVCQVEYEEGEKLVGLITCKHAYHKECITRWLQIKKVCPICSVEVSAPI